MTKPIYGLLARYQTTADIYHACEQVRDLGYQKWDACTPFPVHGLEKAMGLRPSVLPWMVLFAGLFGGTFLMGLEIWVAHVDYPLNIGGKPTLSIPAFVPPAFEFTILFAALTAVFGMFFLNGLPRHHHPLFGSQGFARVTDDGFFIVIEREDPKFDLEETRQMLIKTHAVQVEVLGDEE